MPLITWSCEEEKKENQLEILSMAGEVVFNVKLPDSVTSPLCLRRIGLIPAHGELVDGTTVLDPVAEITLPAQLTLVMSQPATEEWLPADIKVEVAGGLVLHVRRDLYRLSVHNLLEQLRFDKGQPIIITDTTSGHVIGYHSSYDHLRNHLLHLRNRLLPNLRFDKGQPIIITDTTSGHVSGYYSSYDHLRNHGYSLASFNGEFGPFEVYIPKMTPTDKMTEGNPVYSIVRRNLIAREYSSMRCVIIYPVFYIYQKELNMNRFQLNYSDNSPEVNEAISAIDANFKDFVEAERQYEFPQHLHEQLISLILELGSKQEADL